MNQTEIIHPSDNAIQLVKPNGYTVFLILFLCQFIVSFMFNVIRKAMYLCQTNIKKFFGIIIGVTLNYLCYSIFVVGEDIDKVYEESYFWITSGTIFIIDLCIYPM